MNDSGSKPVSRQLVVVKNQQSQAGESAEFGRDGSRQTVVSKPQILKVREVAEFL